MKSPKEFMINHPMLGMGSGNNGFFRFKKDNVILNVQASDGAGWEHVSVSTNKNRCPTWEEMCFIKDYFWDESETVIQYHPAKKDYVNVHKYCLHLWRPIGIELPKPQTYMIG